MIYVIAEMRFRPGTPESAFDQARKLIAETNKEEGCMAYDMHRSITDPDRIVVVERWKSREALSQHFETPHMKAWRANSDFVIERKIDVITPENVEKL